MLRPRGSRWRGSGDGHRRGQAAHLLEYDTPSGRVRWELGEGTGHGARLVLTHTCPPGERATTLAAWRDHLGRLATRLHGRPR
ncbi:hypothetical protein [Sphaerisporangium album]|uniref:hypothetical protein n=1 Tax=Sphaerisporangium album TaxID=509200 RepID=UPI0015F08483|nr:hypothetical protein [Sphaerisporangium album]